MKKRQRHLRHESLESRQLLDASGLMPAGEPVEDFSLVDVNPTSSTFNQSVSLSSHTGETTAWYLMRSW